ncbi:hypothetical protein [Streptomyces sp. NPDC059819]
MVDPGLGFAKDRNDDWELLASIDDLARLGCPVVIVRPASASSARSSRIR